MSNSSRATQGCQDCSTRHPGILQCLIDRLISPLWLPLRHTSPHRVERRQNGRDYLEVGNADPHRWNARHQLVEDATERVDVRAVIDFLGRPEALFGSVVITIQKLLTGNRP